MTHLDATEIRSEGRRLAGPTTDHITDDIGVEPMEILVDSVNAESRLHEGGAVVHRDHIQATRSLAQ